jgi:hypothetical protein
VNPLYACLPEILWDRKSLVTTDWFAKKYNLCNRGITPKQIKIGHHLEEADVESLFGPGRMAMGIDTLQWMRSLCVRWRQCG